MDFGAFATNVISTISTAGIRVVIAFLLLIIGFIIINKISDAIKKYCIKKNVDKTLGKTGRYLFRIAAKVIWVIMLLGYLGINTASISAVIAAAGLGIGLAVQGALANFAGGVILLITKPFKTDDFISAQGIEGTVEEIRIINTMVKTLDNKLISIPNGGSS